MKPKNLKLIARTEEDLRVVSAHLQDSIASVSDIANLKKNKIFLMQLSRFMWEDVEKGVFRKNDWKKEECAERVRNIKNDTSAKILYKQCMKEQKQFVMTAIRDLVADILGVSPDAATFIICVPALLFAIYLIKK